MNTNTKPYKWIKRILTGISIVGGIIVTIFIGAVIYEIYELATDPEFEWIPAPVVLTTVDTLPEPLSREVVLHTPLEAVGYIYERPFISQPSSPRITHHIYIGQLEDSDILVLPTIDGQMI